MLISMIFSSFQTPIYVLANELTDNSSSTTTTPEKGDMKLGKNGEITKEGTVSVISKSNNEKIEVKKTAILSPVYLAMPTVPPASMNG